MEAFPGGIPAKDLLDAVVPDRPVALPNRDVHGMGVNSKALEVCGITRDTPDPFDGRIERDADGEPNGCLQEGAMALVNAHLPVPTAREMADGLPAGQAYLHSFGITAWQDARVGAGLGGDVFGTYIDAEASGTLTARVAGALWWDREGGLEQLELFRERRESAGRGRFRARTVKLMLDGVAENHTAALLSPYTAPADDVTGSIEVGKLADLVVLDRDPFDGPAHEIGDARVLRTFVEGVQVFAAE